MIKRLDQIEQYVAESTFLAAELLLDSSSISISKGPEKHLWIFKVKDKSIFEVEIQTSPKYIKSFTCDCQQKLICSHVAGSMLLLRAKKMEVAQKKSLSKVSKTSVQKLNVENIFRQISQQDIYSFVKQYAKSNSKFDLAMKVNFARKVQVTDLSLKYKQLLDKLLKPLKRIDEHYTTSGINNYLKHARELFEQYKDAVSLHSYLEAAIIITLLLKKTAYALDNTRVFQENLTRFNENLHQHIDDLFKENMAPELREKLVDKLLEIVELSYYHIPSFFLNIGNTIQKYGDIKEKKELHEVIIVKLSSNIPFNEFSEFSVLLVMNARETNSSYSFIYQHIKQHHLQDFFSLLMKVEYFDEIQDIIKHCKTIAHLKSFSYDDVLLVIARRGDSADIVVPLLSKKFLRTKNSIFVDQMVEYDPVFWKPEIPILRRAIQDNLAYAKNTIYFLILEQEFVLLIDFIFQHELYNLLSESINDIFDYDPLLIDLLMKKYKEKCEEDQFHAHRNQVYLLIALDNIFDPKSSMMYLRDMREFKEKLEEKMLAE